MIIKPGALEFFIPAEYNVVLKLLMNYKIIIIKIRFFILHDQCSMVLN